MNKYRNALIVCVVVIVLLFGVVINQNSKINKLNYENEITSIKLGVCWGQIEDMVRANVANEIQYEPKVFYARH